MEIKIESTLIKPIETLKLAPIWPSSNDLEKLLTNKEHYLKKLLDRYVFPHFLGGMLRYVEKGETILLKK